MSDPIINQRQSLSGQATEQTQEPAKINLGKLLSDYKKEVKIGEAFKTIKGNIGNEQAQSLMAEVRSGEIGLDFAVERSKTMITPLQAQMVRDSRILGADDFYSRYEKGLDGMTTPEFSKFNSLLTGMELKKAQGVKATTAQGKREKKKAIKMIKASSLYNEIENDLMSVMPRQVQPLPGEVGAPHPDTKSESYNTIMTILKDVMDDPTQANYGGLYAELYEYADTIKMETLKPMLEDTDYFLNENLTPEVVRAKWVEQTQKIIKTFINNVSSAYEAGISGEEQPPAGDRPSLDSFNQQ